MDLSSFRVGSARQFLSGARRFLSTATFSNGADATRPSFGIQGNTTDQAVEVVLKNRRGASIGTPDSKSIAELDAIKDGPSPSSGLRSYLKELRSITDRIGGLRSEMEGLTTGSSREQLLMAEIAGLEGEYQRAVQGDPAKRITEIISAVNQTLQGRGSPSALADALAGEVGLLGRDFLARVRGGNISNLQALGASLKNIADLAEGGVGASAGSLDSASRAITNALRSLEGPVEVIAADVTTDPAEQKVLPPPPTIAEVGFEGAGNVALGLRAYVGSDAIQAAMAHMPIDPKTVIFLTVDEGEDERARKREEQEKRKRGTDERFDGSQAVDL